MSAPRRFFNMLLALIMIIAAVIIFKTPMFGYYLILLVLSITLVVMGISSFVYFFTLAKHMVGGRKELFKGLILLDIGLYLSSKADLPVVAIMSYLLILFGVYGVIDLIRAVELKKAGAGTWKIKFLLALLQFALIVAGNIFSESLNVVAWMYAVYLLARAAERVYRSLRKTAIVYIV